MAKANALLVRDALRLAERALAAAGSAAAGLEARVLLRELLGLTAAALYLHLDDLLPAGLAAAYRHLVERRAGGEPLAYLTGRREFYGLDLLVTPAVLVPRPETELLVERAATLLPPGSLAADVGTGSGAIAAALAHGRPDLRLLALDCSLDACRVARENARRHGLAGRVGVLQGDLLAAVAGPLDGVLANLPYLGRGELETLPPDVRREPRQALDGGADGLDLYRRLFADLARRRPPPALVLCEIGPEQGPAALALARRALPGQRAVVRPDLAGRDRLLEVVP